jgi:hypothetical protein
MKIFYTFILCIGVLSATITSIDIRPQHPQKDAAHIKILDQKELVFHTIKGIKFSEISDLAYYPRKKKLFMVSDEGKLFTFKAEFGNKITCLEAVDAVELVKKSGKPFKSWRHDSEGMTLDGRGRLLISFEGKAKIGYFHKNSKKQGRLIRKYKLPRKLRNRKNYRSGNKSLEALAWHPKYGILTAAEWPLKNSDIKYQTIYALNGREWHFQAEKEAKSAISAIEVMDDGNLLVLERSFSGFLNPFVITLKKVYLSKCKHGLCKSQVLAKLNSHKGWSVDNFEGLAKVGDHRYLMVSDDNDNFFQKTLLIYFEVLDQGPIHNR